MLSLLALRAYQYFNIICDFIKKQTTRQYSEFTLYIVIKFTKCFSNLYVASKFWIIWVIFWETEIKIYTIT